jgi:hypothetical protein
MAAPAGIPQNAHAKIQAASKLHPHSGAWAFFMREIIGLPPHMTPAVLQVIRVGTWKTDPSPLTAVRTAAVHAYESAWAKVDGSLKNSPA